MHSYGFFFTTLDNNSSHLTFYFCKNTFHNATHIQVSILKSHIHEVSLVQSHVENCLYKTGIEQHYVDGRHIR